MRAFQLRPLCLSIAVLGLGGAVACGSGSTSDASSSDTESAIQASDVEGADFSGVELVLLTHDSFTVSPGIFDDFTESTGAVVKVESGGDAGELVSRAVLAAGEPEGDVLFGIDNTFLQRGLDADVFAPYESPVLADIPDDLELDAEHRVTPIDVGDVCVNYWIDALAGDPPSGLEDLAAQADQLVVENPEMSSPGLAFLLATIAEYGDDWEDYWQRLADGGVAVTNGWEDAYYGEFVAGGGDRSLVVSYATSPVAEVLFADPPVDSPPTGVVTEACFRQIEFAGVLAGTEHPEAAAALVDYLASPVFQADIPLNMFVAPANSTVTLPEPFVDYGVEIDDPYMFDPAEIEANRSDWTERWTEIVLR